MNTFDLSPSCTIVLRDVSTVEMVGDEPRGFSDAASRDPVLVVMMKNGHSVRLAHRSGSMSEVDAYKKMAELKDALRQHEEKIQ